MQQDYCIRKIGEQLSGRKANSGAGRKQQVELDAECGVLRHRHRRRRGARAGHRSSERVGRVGERGDGGEQQVARVERDRVHERSARVAH